MASDLHHTATTKYPCCVPALGDSEGASCVGLAAANIETLLRYNQVNRIFFFIYLNCKNKLLNFKLLL